MQLFQAVTVFSATSCAALLPTRGESIASAQTEAAQSNKNVHLVDSGGHYLIGSAARSTLSSELGCLWDNVRVCFRP